MCLFYERVNMIYQVAVVGVSTTLLFMYLCGV